MMKKCRQGEVLQHIRGGKAKARLANPVFSFFMLNCSTPFISPSKIEV